VAGIHLHPHDILDEGPEAILRRIGALADIDVLFVEVNTIFERNPYPTGSLPHNPAREVVQGTGTLHVSLPPLQSRVRQRVDPSILAGADPLRTMIEATRDTHYRVVPWANILNGDFLGAAPENAVVDFRGDPVDRWLCPNGPDVAAMWSETLSSLRETYNVSACLIDRIRYPDWAGEAVSPRGLCTCFCPHCAETMKAAGLDPDAVRMCLRELAARAKNGDFDHVTEALRHNPLLTAWQVFRQKSVTRLVQRLQSSMRDRGDALDLWLDLWPPAYSWLLGQDYASLTRIGRVLKHFPYHKLGGGADVQGLITHLASDASSRERAFAAFKSLFDLPYALTYQEFTERGLPIEFVREQNDRVRQLAEPGTFVYSGIQMWNLPPAALLDAIDAADASACDDVIYYCYGWADDALFAAAAQRGPRHLEGRKERP
jgi:hypothetical protein